MGCVEWIQLKFLISYYSKNLDKVKILYFYLIQKTLIKYKSLWKTYFKIFQIITAIALIFLVSHARQNIFRYMHYVTTNDMLTKDCACSLGFLDLKWLLSHYWEFFLFSLIKKCASFSAFQVLVRAIPIKQGHKLRIVWPITPEIHHYKEGPCRYLGHLIGHEGEGSLYYVLKTLGAFLYVLT